MIVTSSEQLRSPKYLPGELSLRSGEAWRAGDDGLVEVLDHICERLKEQEDQKAVNETMDELILTLRACRLGCEPEQWNELVGVCREHPLCEVVHNDPFTYRAFSKPRGYAGDAELLDYIYGREEQWPPPSATPVGRRVFNYTTAAPAPAGVRARRGFVASLIDRMAEEIEMPHVLSVAAGHLREASLCAAIKRRKLGRMVALDADEVSLQEVERCYGAYGVETVAASVRRLLKKRSPLGEFDLVYSTGLFDYLQQPLGRRLVSKMFAMLRPRGRVLIANFLPAVRDVGYMETYMDWFLVYRTRRDMIDLTMEIPEHEIREITLFTEENQNIIFLEITKN